MRILTKKKLKKTLFKLSSVVRNYLKCHFTLLLRVLYDKGKLFTYSLFSPNPPKTRNLSLKALIQGI